ncbi:hypothetical protein [Rhodococcus spelaei]|uniref:hypothetical protein n=1 Tax=Rhodococcus spelaei TaxID=2546320 RepID=UPI0015EF0CFD|nr:hypothetical protein [Rhodococcus spelaei]
MADNNDLGDKTSRRPSALLLLSGLTALLISAWAIIGPDRFSAFGGAEFRWIFVIVAVVVGVILVFAPGRRK